ncbi:hypothetical protein PGT21_002366 [Puccinia graminis f. sp. tritici]|uniref:Uncharacterized protein n=1 Tax=Puccinia graminis f. sp. tritici TaxID=56615 RepID=A0A5B0MTE7_PUCGR|nr:hypothetical protein PGT21_002366 [Puccinia graminis f. sp. tritici]
MPNVCRMKDPDDVFLVSGLERRYVDRRILSDLHNSDSVNALKLERPKITSIAAFRIYVGLKGSIGFGTYTISILPSRRSRFSFVCRAGLQASSHLAIAVHVQVFLGEAYED